MTVEHWMMFGTFAQQNYFEYPDVGTYDGIIINGNMAVHAPAGIASFLLQKTAGRSKYLVDPLTHAYQHDPTLISNSEGEPKSSIKNLACEYGEPLSSLVGKRPVLPEDFSLNTKMFELFVKRCVRFQIDYLRNYMSQSTAAKYLEQDEIKPPYAAIAPYFYLDETTLEDWLEICVESVRLTRKALKETDHVKLFAAVVVSRGIIVDADLRHQVTEAFQKSGVDIDGFLLWVDDLDEQQANKTELSGLLAFSKLLCGNGRYELINLHGGYFSILAGGIFSASSFSGIAHGPEYGESRSVVPVGGGIPIARYYIPQIHTRIRYRDALRILKTSGWLNDASSFHRHVCDCVKCKDVIAGDAANFQKFGESNVRNVRRRHGIVRIEFPTGDATVRCLCHYLQRKKMEYEAVGKLSKNMLFSELKKGEDQFREAAGLEWVTHLRRWREILERGAS